VPFQKQRVRKGEGEGRQQKEDRKVKAYVSGGLASSRSVLRWSREEEKGTRRGGGGVKLLKQDEKDPSGSHRKRAGWQSTKGKRRGGELQKGRRSVFS